MGFYLQKFKRTVSYMVKYFFSCKNIFVLQATLTVLDVGSGSIGLNNCFLN